MAARSPFPVTPHIASASVPCATRLRSSRSCRALSWRLSSLLLGQSVGDLRATDQRGLLDVVLRKDLFEVLDLRQVIIGNIRLARVQRQVVLMIGLGRKKSLQRTD